MKNLKIALVVLMVSMQYLSFATFGIPDAPLANNTPLPPSAGAPLLFMENAGQVTDQSRNPRSDIQFSLHATPGLNVFIGNGAIHYQFCKVDVTKTIVADKSGLFVKKQAHEKTSAMFYRMDVELIGANKNAKAITSNTGQYYENYFNERTGGKSITAHSFGRVVYQDVYPGIDWILFVSNGKLKHEFLVKNGANPGNIRLRYHGTTGLQLASDGSLVATTPMGVITENAPESFQADGTPVKSAFSLVGNELVYNIGDYNGELTIDPGLAWCTYIGGLSYDIAFNVAIDNAENVFASGQTQSWASIATTGAYSTTISGVDDAFLSKFNSAGTIQWSTYYGGGSEDWAHALTVDGGGNAYIAGHTWSSSGIATTGAHQTYWAGASASWGDAFLAKFNPAGGVVWSTYYGGSGDDIGAGLTVTGAGDILMTGGTASLWGVATTGAHITTYDTYHRAFLTKFTNAGVQLWGTYCSSGASAIVSDVNGNIYLGGSADALGAVGTPGSHQPAFAGGWADGFLARFNSSGFLQWGTFYGGEYSDYGNSVAVDDSGFIYLAGETESNTGISTPGAYKPVKDTPQNDAFVAKFDSSGSRIWGTYFGGTGRDRFAGIATDHNGNIWLAGATASTTGIATPDGYRASIGDTGVVDPFYSADIMLIRMNTAGMPVWGTYYGGESAEAPSNLAVSDTTIAICGWTASFTGFATPGAFDVTHGATSSGSWYNDAFVTVFSNCMPLAPATVSGPASVCIGSSITLSASVPGGTWSSASTTIATVAGGTVTGIAAGSSAISYSLTNLCGVAATSTPISVIDCSLGVADVPASGIKIYPNPATDAITIVAPNSLGKVMIVDMLGREVFNETFSKRQAGISLGGLPGGLYIVHLLGRSFKVTKL